LIHSLQLRVSVLLQTASSRAFCQLQCAVATGRLEVSNNTVTRRGLKAVLQRDRSDALGVPVSMRAEAKHVDLLIVIVLLFAFATVRAGVYIAVTVTVGVAVTVTVAVSGGGAGAAVAIGVMLLFTAVVTVTVGVAVAVSGVAGAGVVMLLCTCQQFAPLVNRPAETIFIHSLIGAFQRRRTRPFSIVTASAAGVVVVDMVGGVCILGIGDRRAWHE